MLLQAKTRGKRWQFVQTFAPREGRRIGCRTQRAPGTRRMRYNPLHEIVSIQPRDHVPRDNGAVHCARSSAGSDRLLDCVSACFHPLDSLCFHSFVKVLVMTPGPAYFEEHPKPND
jgi:hypothetical protein